VTGYASDEWHRVAPHLHRLGLLTVIDVAPLAAYAMAYARWRQAEEALARVAESDVETSGLMVKTAVGDSRRRNPLVKIAADAAGDMVRYAGLFGMTAIARSRLVAGVYGQPPGGKFDGFLGGGA
jgi:P27 family predicted phage terminase small subunit